MPLDRKHLEAVRDGQERAAAQRKSLPAPEFRSAGEGRYRLVAGDVVSLDVDFLRREGAHLKGELLVRCQLPGARTFDDILSIGDFNLSSPRTRSTHAKHLAERARTKDGEVPWADLLEELCQRVLAAEREGQPAVLLSDLPRPSPDDLLWVDGLPLLRRHPVLLFGDGGTAKSYLALYIAGTLAEEGHRVGLFDWELDGEDHRDRLERLFGSEMPPIQYARCTRPLVYEAERLRRIVRDEELDFVVFDSVAFACDGPPEAAEVAGRYFQALRQLGPLGSLHVAHVSKSFEGADQKPFGSVFWHNGARASWNVKQATAAPDDHVLTIALHNRKANLGAKRPSVGFEFTFSRERTDVRRVDLANVAELAATLPIGERIRVALRAGPKTREQLAASLEDVNPSSLRTALKRAKERGVILEFPGQDGADRLSLAHRRDP